MTQKTKSLAEIYNNQRVDIEISIHNKLRNSHKLFSDLCLSKDIRLHDCEIFAVFAQRLVKISHRHMNATFPFIIQKTTTKNQWPFALYCTRFEITLYNGNGTSSYRVDDSSVNGGRFSLRFEAHIEDFEDKCVSNIIKLMSNTICKKINNVLKAETFTTETDRQLYETCLKIQLGI